MDEKLKILLTVGIYPPEIGGPATYVSSLAVWSNQQKGLEVSVATASNYKIDESDFKIYKVKKKIKLLWRLNYFFMALKNTKYYNLIYINGLFTESAIAALLRKKPYLIRIPGDVIWERWRFKKGNELNIDDFQNYKGSFKIRFLRKIRKIYLNKAERIIAPSNYLAKLIEIWGVDEKKIEVIYNPYMNAELEKIDLDIIKTESFNIVTGGRLVNWKGVESVIKACERLKGVRLIIIGDGPESNRLKKIAKDLKMNEKIIFTDVVSRGQLRTIFEKSDCFVLNSKYEGLPHIVLEAMEAGCPVAVSNTGGNTEVVEHENTGLLFDVDDVEAIAKSIKYYRENAVFSKAIIENAKKELAENFNRDIQFKKTVKTITDALK